MKSKFVLSAILAALTQMLPAAALADDLSLVTANNGFGFKLLAQLAKDQPAENIFISPYSAATVLQMVDNGAGGQTKAEMQRVLGTGNLADADVNAANKSVAESLNTQNPDIILNTANAIWYRQGITVKPDFLACNRDFFEATVDALDFADPSAMNVINQWASDKTHGRITHIADKMIDPRTTALLLANAVYFKAKWAERFKVRATRDRPFYLPGGSRKTVPMMTQTRAFAYQRGANYQAVCLPYEGGNLAMFVFLPDTNSSPEALLNIGDGDNWQRVIKPGFNDEEGTLVLPKFKFDYGTELKNPLRTLGMKTAFERGQADFSGITSQPVYISGVLQKTFVEVKEEGTEAAAVTAISFGAEAIEMQPPKRFEMVVNRPFLFLIEDNRTGVFLFVGMVFDPS
jgi:serine protease inhibitor